MDARPLSWIATACGGELLTGSPETPVCRVGSDSRRIQRGDLFFALPGERFDGHAFLSEAAGKGAAAAVVARGQCPASLSNCALIAVDDTRQALGRLAARYRRDFSLPVLAVAGSNGKTTTKELVASVLQQKFPTLSSQDSFNNDIGVPLTLLRLENAHRAAVLEAGTNHPGELAPLLAMISPRLGVLTSIAREHLEFFGDLPGVALEEGRLAEVLPPEGILFANGDCQWTGVIARRGPASLVRVGLSETNDWRAADLRPDNQGVTFKVQGPRPDLAGEFRINLLGGTRSSMPSLRSPSAANWDSPALKSAKAWPSASLPRCACNSGSTTESRSWMMLTTPMPIRCSPPCRPFATCLAKAAAWPSWATWRN